MTHYIRPKVTGATWFFTLHLADRRSTVLLDHIDLLRQAYRRTWVEQPFETRAIVILPGAIHAIWTLPAGDADVMPRWRKIKARFGQAMGAGASHDGGLWQRRVWDHVIRNQTDHDHHLQFCLMAPVRLGLVDLPGDWTFSSIHRDLRSAASLARQSVAA